MVPLVTRGGVSVLLLGLCLGLGFLFGLAGCGSSGKPDGPTDQLAGSQLEQAERLFSELEKAHAAGRISEAVEPGRYHPESIPHLFPQ